MPMSVSVVVPVFNEADGLRAFFENLTAALDRLPVPAEIVFANDGSSDGSSEVLDDFARRDHRVTVVHLRRNYGQTAAMMAAIQRSVGDVIIPMDADGQNDPTDIPRLLEKLDEGYDVVSG